MNVCSRVPKTVTCKNSLGAGDSLKDRALKEHSAQPLFLSTSENRDVPNEEVTVLQGNVGHEIKPSE